MIFTKNATQAKAAMLTDFASYTGATPPTGSVLRAILDDASDQLTDVYNSLRQLSSNAFLSGASGEYLDAIGALFNLPRLQPTNYPSIGGIIIYTYDNSALSTKISASAITGLQVQSTYGDQFTVTTQPTSDQMLLSSLQLTATVNYATTQTLSQNTITVCNSLPSGVLVTNTAIITTFTSQETDDAYRYRLLNTIQSAQTGNIAAIKLAALSVPGVASVYIQEGTRGAGSFDLYIVGENISTQYALLDTVAATIANVVSAGINYTVQTPHLIEVSVAATVYASNASVDDLTPSVTSALTAYIDNLGLGASLSVPGLQQTVANSDSRIISVSSLTAYLTIVDSYGIAHTSTLYQPTFTIGAVEQFIIAQLNPVSLTVLSV